MTARHAVSRKLQRWIAALAAAVAALLGLIVAAGIVGGGPAAQAGTGHYRAADAAQRHADYLDHHPGQAAWEDRDRAAQSKAAYELGYAAGERHAIPPWIHWDRTHAHAPGAPHSKCVIVWGGTGDSSALVCNNGFAEGS